jgi:hypothetical protein
VVQHGYVSHASPANVLNRASNAHQMLINGSHPPAEGGGNPPSLDCIDR